MFHAVEGSDQFEMELELISSIGILKQELETVLGGIVIGIGYHLKARFWLIDCFK